MKNGLIEIKAHILYNSYDIEAFMKKQLLHNPEFDSNRHILTTPTG